MLRADYRILLSQRDLSSWLFLLHTWPLLSSSSIKRCAVEAWFCEETGTRGLISVAWRRGEESEGIFFSLSRSSPHLLNVCKKQVDTQLCGEQSVKNELGKMHRVMEGLQNRRCFCADIQNPWPHQLVKPPHQMRKWFITLLKNDSFLPLIVKET